MKTFARIALFLYINVLFACTAKEELLNDSGNPHNPQKEYLDLDEAKCADLNHLSSLSSGSLVRLRNGLVLEKRDSCFFLEGDMRYNASQLAELGEISTEYYSNRSESPSSFPTYWCGRIVPYEFDSSFTGSYQNEALYAMSLISSSCGVDFVPATYQTDRIVFHVSNGNNSPVGKEGGSQVINI